MRPARRARGFFQRKLGRGDAYRWNIRGLRTNTVNYAIACADANTTLYNFTIDPISEQQSNGINIPGTLGGGSKLRLAETVVNIGKVTTGTEITCDTANLTIGAGFNQARIFNTAAPQISGFGTPTGAATGGAIADFNGASATLAEATAMIALILELGITDGRYAP